MKLKTIVLLSILLFSFMSFKTYAWDNSSYDNRLNVSYADSLNIQRNFEDVRIDLIHHKPLSEFVFYNTTENITGRINITRVNSTYSIIFIQANITAGFNGTIGYLYYNNNTKVVSTYYQLSSLSFLNDTFDDNDPYDNSTGYGWVKASDGTILRSAMTCSGGICTTDTSANWLAYGNKTNFPVLGWNNYTVIANINWVTGGTFFGSYLDRIPRLSCKDIQADSYLGGTPLTTRHAYNCEASSTPISTLSSGWHNSTYVSLNGYVELYMDGTLLFNYSSGLYKQQTGTVWFGGYTSASQIDSILVYPNTNYRNYNATITTTSEDNNAIHITNPTNTTYYGNTNISLNATSTINGTWKYELNGASNVTIRTFGDNVNTSFIASSGSNTLKVFVNGTSNLQNSVSFTVSLNITLIYPSNTTYYEFNRTLEATTGLVGTWQYELNGEPNVSLGTTSIINTTFLSNTGTNTIKLFYNDSISNLTTNISFYTFMGVNLTILNGLNLSKIDNFDVKFDNVTNITLDSNKINNYLKEWSSISSRGITTITINHTLYSNFTTTTILIDNQTFTNVILYGYKDQYFYLNSSIGGGMQNWTIILTNGTTTTSLSTGNFLIVGSLINLPLGNVNFSTFSFGQMTYSGNLTFNQNSSYNISFLTNISTLTIYFWDEDTNMQLALSNVTTLIYNISSLVNYTGYNASISIPISSLPLGFDTISVFYGGGNRNYYLTILDNQSQVLNTFFPSTALYFTHVTHAGGQILNGTLITLQKYINGTFRSYVQGLTQIDGKAIILVEPNFLNRVVVTHQGYNTLTYDYTYSAASVSNEINIFLTSTSGSTGFPAVNTFIIPEITVTWNPANTSLLYNQTSINVTVTDSAGLLQYVYLNVSLYNYTNTSNFYFINLTGSQSYTINTTIVQQGVYTYNFCVYRNSTTYCAQRIYTYRQLYGIGNYNAEQNERAGGLSVGLMKILLLIGLCIATGIGFAIMGPAVVILDMGIFAYGWMSSILNPLEAISGIIICFIIMIRAVR